MRFLDESRLSPSNVFLPISPRATSPPLDQISPTTSSETVVPLRTRPSGDYFGTAVLASQEDECSEESGPTCYGAAETDADDSDDSIDLSIKRTSTVSRSVAFGPESDQILQRQSK
jgi:hypothetical protein